MNVNNILRLASRLYIFLREYMLICLSIKLRFSCNCYFIFVYYYRHVNFNLQTNILRELSVQLISLISSLLKSEMT